MSRVARWVVIAGCSGCLLALGLAVSPTAASAQSRDVRFEITQVGDTTFRFPRGSAAWLKAGASGIAVDPRRRDVLVARFRIVRIDSGMVTALVTGQTTRVATEHIAVITEPSKPWYKGATFWVGAAIGLIVGLVVGGA